MYRYIFPLLLVLLGCTLLNGQRMSVDFEFQAYPTGLIPGVRISKLFQERNAVHLRLGYNWIRHQDFGVHEDERGAGFGGTIGFQRHLKKGYTGWFWGVRADVWFNQLDWKDNIGTGNEERGTSDIIVVQPTAEAGYTIRLGDNDWHIRPSLGFGFEVNVKTEGEEVGQGAILLGGISLGRLF